MGGRYVASVQKKNTKRKTYSCKDETSLFIVFIFLVCEVFGFISKHTVELSIGLTVKSQTCSQEQQNSYLVGTPSLFKFLNPGEYRERRNE
jgi:hypothetical protein